MSAAIYFHPEAYTTSGPKLMGRNAAGESFLRGFFTYSRTNDGFWTQVQHLDHAKAFAATLQACGRTEGVRAVDKNSLAALAQPGTVYHPGPGIGQHAWQRAGQGHAAWSLCGITHTTSSAGAMDAIAELLVAPVQSWDALICTSTAVRDNVDRLLQAQGEYLRTRLGATQLVVPLLPVIPLGIHTADFSFTEDQRAAARAAVGADAGTLVVLYTGRLSFHAKAHPLAMYQALEKAAAGLPDGGRIVLVECGWHANAFIANAYAAAARSACPSVRVLTLDGRIASARETAWACADVFCSLADNIQETFGIVPIEAMAAGLPVVVSDWDGYKDTVRHGIDGFRIPTLQPQAGLGSDLAWRHALNIDNYDMYCGLSSTLVAVDIEAAASAFSDLFAAPALRQRMGEAGRQRAREVYDWAAIIPRYEALWAQQTDLRQQHTPPAPPIHAWPARMDPFYAFAGYPSHTLTPQTMLALTDSEAGIAAARLAAYRQLDMVNFAPWMLPTEVESRAVLDAAAAGPRSALQLVGAIADERKAQVLRALAWFVKMGVLRVMD